MTMLSSSTTTTHHSKKSSCQHPYPREVISSSTNNLWHEENLRNLPTTTTSTSSSRVELSAEALFVQIKFGTYEAFRRVVHSTTTAGGATSNFQLVESYYYYGEDGHTLAHWAAKRAPDLRFMELLISKGFPLHLPSQDNVGMYPIHWAATEGSLPIVSLLLEHIHTSCTINSNTNNNKKKINNNNNSSG